MKNRIKNAISALRQNSGSGVISVLVAMMFLTILGMIMLFMSYTGLLMKVTEREGTDNFYQAESAMNVIRAQVQEAVSDTISVAYHEVLSQYSDNAESQFQSAFVTNFYEYQYEYTASNAADASLSGTKELFPEFYSGVSNPDDARYYDVSVFEEVIAQAALSNSALENITVTVDEDSQYSSNDSYGTVTVSTGEVSLDGICVTYTNPDTGYSTTITTDIVCNAPDFYSSSLSYSITTVPNFALIAQEEISKDVGNNSGETVLSIDGNAYAGSFSLGETAYEIETNLSLEGGTLIVSGDTTLSNDVTFTIGESAEIWTQNILLEGGTVVLEGTAYVADDLELNGEETTVEVPSGSSASYYGFGYGTTSSGSAIIINGRYTELNLDGISNLMLAGQSFITDATSDDTTSSGVMMGESVSVKSNQLLYLAPVDILDEVNDDVEITSNPALYTGNTTESTAPAVNANPSDYYVNGVAIAEGTEIKTLIYNLDGNTKAYYYYLDFQTAEAANDYFVAYFEAYPENIEEYISFYSDGIQLPDGSTMSASAVEVTYNDSEEVVLGLVDAIDSSLRDQMYRDAEALALTYAALCKTLSTVQTSTATDMNPYKYIVETEEINAFAISSSSYAFKNTEGDDVAKLISGSYTVADGETADLIIATGDVTINATSYSGLIIAGGNISLGTSCISVTADEDAVNAAFQAIYTDSDGVETPFYTFLNSTVIGNTDSSSVAEDYTWNLDELVVYDDWSKS